MVSTRNKNAFQGPKIEDYIFDLPKSEKYLKSKLKIPKNISDRITWQQFEDDIINEHINQYILYEDKELKAQFPQGLDSIRDQIADTSDFFSGKVFAKEWNEIAFKIWDTHKKNYLALLFFIDNLQLKNNNPNTVPEEYHYLATKSQTLIPLKDLLLKRKHIHIKKRWLNVLDPYLKKGKWSEEEDALLISKHKEYGSQWSKIAMDIPRRTVDQCSKRFHEALDPDRSTKNHVAWSIEEDFMLINTLKELGSKWRAIALQLNSNRSALNCRNRWRKIINGYIKGKRNPQIAALIDDLSKDYEFEDIVKLRELIQKKEVQKVERKMNKAKKEGRKIKSKEKDNIEDYEEEEEEDDDEEEEEEGEEGEEEEEEEEEGDISEENIGEDNYGVFNHNQGKEHEDIHLARERSNYEQKDVLSEVEPPYGNPTKDNFISKNGRASSIGIRNSIEPEHSLTSNGILMGENIHRQAPSLVSNFLEQQFDQQQFSGNQHMQSLSPGPFHASMSPPPNLPLGLLQTPKPHDIISSLRTTQLPTTHMNNIHNINSNMVTNNSNNNSNSIISPMSSNTNKFHKNTPIQSLQSSTSLNKNNRPSSVPLKSNSTEWKFQLKQKNLTLSSGNITSEKLVSLLIEQAKLNNLKISIHQHIHNHYMPILDNSEQGSSLTTTPGSEQNNNNNSNSANKGQGSLLSNNSPSTGNSNAIAGSFGNKVIKDLNEIGAYRVKHFKQLDVKKLPKLASSNGSSTKRRNGSITGSSPGSIHRKKVKFNNNNNNITSNNGNTNNNSNNNSARSSIVGSNEYENAREDFDFWDALMQSNPLSHVKENNINKNNIGIKSNNNSGNKNEQERDKADSQTSSGSSGTNNNGNELEYYMLGFNPS
ncbi:hypothetical protein ACO0SA_004693 [Hanseniaspora valbyensis]